MSQPASSKRRVMLAKVHIALSELGYSDTQYRDILHVQFGVDSASHLSDAKLDELIKFFKAKGWKNKKIGKKPAANRDAGSMMRAIEGLLASKANFEKKPVAWGYAKSILKRQTGIDKLEWADGDQLHKVVIALIYDAKRKGYYDGN